MINSTMKKLKLMHIALLILHIFFMLYMTLLNRNFGKSVDYELVLFWSYKRMFFRPGMALFNQIVLNIILFLPFGFLISGLIKRSHFIFRVSLIALLFSILIELSQLVFKVGLFEFDDMFNNTLGAFIGAGMYYSYLEMRKSGKIRNVLLGLIPLLVCSLFFIIVYRIKV